MANKEALQMLASYVERDVVAFGMLETTTCFIGNGARLWGFNSDRTDLVAAKLGLTSEEADDLFYPARINHKPAPTRAEAVDVLRRFATTGRIEWLSADQAAEAYEDA